jgi:hypothetical protein
MNRRHGAITLATALLTVVAAHTIRAQSQQPPRDQPATQRGTGIVRGRVVDASTKRPLRGVVIALGDASTLTDGDGRYEMRELAAGRYTVSARFDGYLTTAFGQTRPLGAGTPVVLRAGQIAANVDIELPRGAAIAGTLRDENGDVVPGAQVRALRPTYSEGRKTLALDTNTTTLGITDDRGAFRIYGLIPGDYYVAALVPAGPPAENSGAGFAPTYFPGTTNFAEASRVTARIGEQAPIADFSVRMTRLAAVSGVVADPQGSPPASVMLGIRQAAAGALIPFAIRRPAPDGTFRLSSLPPGEYDISATTPLASGNPLAATEHVIIAGSDVNGVRLTLSPLTKGRGRIVSDEAAMVPLSNTYVRLFDVSDTMPYRPRAAGAQEAWPVRADGTFEVASVPGRMALTISSGMPAGWFVKAIREDGRDVTHRGVDFAANGAIAEIEVIVTRHPSQVSGTVRAPGGDPPGDYTAIVFARDPDARKGPTRYFGMARPDADGGFVIGGLPAGDYYAIALDYADVEASADPDFLGSLVHDATPFSLPESGAATLTLPLVKAP